MWYNFFCKHEYEKRLAVLMAKMIRDKDSLSFKEATANMTVKEKIGYIWEYYKWIILGSSTIILVIFSMTHAFLTRMDPYLNITFINGFEYTLHSFEQPDLDVEDEAIDLSEETFFPEPPAGIWVDFEMIPTLEDLLLDDRQQSNYEITVQQLGINFETISVFATHTGAGVIDIIITYIPDLHAMVEVGHFQNISDLGWDIPAHKMHNEYAIYLRYFPIFDDYTMAADDHDLVLGISTTTQRIESIENFFDILLD